MRYIVDTSIIIDHLRGQDAATQWLEQVERGLFDAAISVLTEYELFVVPRLTDHQRGLITQLLLLVPSLPVNSAVARRAARLHRDFNADLADALIAATAIEHEAILLTKNVKDFQSIHDLNIVTL